MNLPILIGITQQVVAIPEKKEYRDTLDQAWISFFKACNLEPLLIPNNLPNPADYLKRLGAKGIVLTGGNNFSDAVKTIQGKPISDLPYNTDILATMRDKTEVSILNASLKNDWPVLGVCRGMQLLNIFHNGQIFPVTGHAGHQHPICTYPEKKTFFSLAFDDIVNSFHDFGVLTTNVMSEFQILATIQNVIEAFSHRRYKHMGIMWHPERNFPPSPNDVALFQNFFHQKS